VNNQVYAMKCGVIRIGNMERKLEKGRYQKTGGFRGVDMNYGVHSCAVVVVVWDGTKQIS